MSEASCKRRLSQALVVVGPLAAVFALCTTVSAEPPTLKMDSNAAIFSRLSEEGKGLLRQYQEHYPQLKDFYSNVTIKARVKQYKLPWSSDGHAPPAPDATLQLTEVQDYVFRGNGGRHYRVDCIDYDPSDGSTVTRSRVGFISPKEVHLLQRASSDREYSVAVYDKNREKATGVLQRCQFQNAAFGFLGDPLEYWLFQTSSGAGTRMIETVETRQENGEALAVISMSLLGVNGSKGSMRFTFLQDRSWALKEITYLMEMKDPTDVDLNLARSSCIYEGEADGIPLLKEYRIDEGTKNKSTGNERIFTRAIAQVESLTPGAPDLSLFDVKRLLGSKVGEVRGESYRFRIICVTVGALLVLIGVYFRRRAARSVCSRAEGNQ